DPRVYQAAQDPAAAAQIRDAIRDEMDNLLEVNLKVDAIKGLQYDLSGIRFLPSPVGELQAKAAAAKDLDDLLFYRASINPNGALVLDGLFGTAEQLRQAEKLVKDYAGQANSALARVNGKTPAWMLKRLPGHAETWSKPLVEKTQADFAADKDDR